MKSLIISTLLIVGMATAAYAGGMMLLRVGDSNGNGFGPPPSDCGTGVVDLSTGCPQPMLR